MLIHEVRNRTVKGGRRARSRRTLGFSSAALHAPISTLMATDVACVRDDMSVEELLSYFLAESLHDAPVLSKDATLVGFVSMGDLVRERADHGDTEEVTLRVRLAAGGGYELGPGFHALAEVRMVADIMTQPVICLQGSATVTMAAALMAFEGVRRLPIVDSEQQVIGVLSALDLLRWFGQQDGYTIPGYTQRELPAERS
jgi:CBS domain-containing protein